MSGASDSLALELRDLDAGGQAVKRVPLAAGGGFALRFTHSMYGGSVEEAFQARAGEAQPVLVRSGVRVEHAGAAEYYARYGNMRRDETGWIVDVPPLAIERLPLRVDRVGQPMLVVDGVEMALLEVVPEGHLLELRAVAGTTR